MKNNHFGVEAFVSLILIILVALLLNPFAWFMPSPMVMTIIIGLVVVFAIFSSFIWKERVSDERELMHRTISGRIAFLAGTTVLVAGIIVEGLAHQVDVWLVLTLTVMILAKIITSIYTNLKN